MGTFRARFTLTSRSGDAFNIVGSGDDEYNQYINTNSSGVINYEISGDNWFLDGSPTGISFGELPAGFTPVPPLELTTPASIMADPEDIAFLQANGASVASAQLNYGDYGPNSESSTGGVIAIVIVNDIPFDTAFDLTNLMTIAVQTVHNILLASAIVPSVIDISGEYTVLQWTFAMDPVSGSEVNANTPGHDTPETADGDLITITSDPEDPDHLLLDELTLSVTCGSIVIKTQTETLLEFWIPSGCGTTEGGNDVSIIATGNGVQFSGSVPLASLLVLFTNGSGIYVLTPGQAHDVIYSSDRDGTTRNVKIPNPTFKTGFIGG